MNNVIEQFYLENNYPSADKLYKILKKNNHSITLSKIKEWLLKQETEQIMKPVKKQSTGHIVAFKQNEFWNIDIFDLSKFEKHNKGYKYIFCAIDIFTRKVFCAAMKNKNIDSVISAFEDILNRSKPLPTMIISDSDSTFLSKRFEKLLEDNNIIHNVVPVGDHHTLGVIDRFALTLKRILSKQREITKSANWVDDLDRVISTYNKTDHRALNDLTPNEAGQEKYKQEITKLNIDKAQSNKIQSDLLPGDKVRLLDKKLFKKGSEPQYTAEIFTVESVRGKTIHLTNGLVKKRDMLLKVHKDTIGSKNEGYKPLTVTQKITKEKTIERKLKADGVDAKNILTSRRR